MTVEAFEMLKSITDPYEYHLIGRHYYRAGSYGLSKHKKNRDLERIATCNDFRNKTFDQVKKELSQ